MADRSKKAKRFHRVLTFMAGRWGALDSSRYPSLYTVSEIGVSFENYVCTRVCDMHVWVALGRDVGIETVCILAIY